MSKVKLISYPEGITLSVESADIPNLQKLNLIWLDPAFGENQDKKQWCFDDEKKEFIDKAIQKNNLDNLRELNNGYNPENLENNYDIVSLDLLAGELVLVRKGESKQDKTLQEKWIKVDAASEEEFIICFSKIYGIIYKDQFFIRESDFNSL